MSEVVKGIVLGIDEEECRVAPADDVNEVSPKISVPSYIEDLSKGDYVAYVVFCDGTGIIIGKM